MSNLRFRVLVLVATSILLTTSYGTAQSTATISNLLPASQDGTAFASVIGINPTATTYAMGCGTSTMPIDSCGITVSYTYTWGPTSVHFTRTTTDKSTTTNTYTYSVQCDYAGTTRAVCSTGLHGEKGSITTTITYSELAYETLLVTAGAEILPQATGSQAAGNKTTGNAVTSSVPTSGTISSGHSPTATPRPSHAGVARSSPANWGMIVPLIAIAATLLAL